jgi:hypothetical protein
VRIEFWSGRDLHEIHDIVDEESVNIAAVQSWPGIKTAALI